MRAVYLRAHSKLGWWRPHRALRGSTWSRMMRIWGWGYECRGRLLLAAARSGAVSVRLARRGDPGLRAASAERALPDRARERLPLLDPERHLWAYALDVDGVTPYLFAHAFHHPVWYVGPAYAND